MDEIEIKDLMFSYGVKEVLRGISFSVSAGDFVFIIGPNGAGKTTLLKNLNRILEGCRGEIVIRGRELSHFSRRELARLIAYVPQNHPDDIPFTVEEFVMQGRYPYLSPFSTISKEDRRVVNSAIERVGVTPLRDRMLNSLSGGERQRAFVAAALAQEAPILLLDEPTVFLDPRHRQEVYQLLEDLNQCEKITIISVTHEINMAFLYSSRIIALKEGRLVSDCTPEKMMNIKMLKRVFDADFVMTPHPETGTRMALLRKYPVISQ